MKRDKLIPGIILIGLGVIFLLHSFGIVHFHWFNFIRMWPVFLVIAGINLMLSNVRAGWASALRIIVVLGGICLLLFASIDNSRSGWPAFNFRYNIDNDNDADNDSADDRKIVKMEGTNEYTESFHPGVKEAMLKIQGGATRYELRDTTADLFHAVATGYGSNYNFNSDGKDSSYTINFNMAKNSHRFNWDDNDHGNEAKIKLNTLPVWDIDINTGATEVNFDLSKFKIRNLDLNGGAASFKVKMGQPLADTRLDINTGVSEVKISIPQNAACQIITDSGLSSNQFDGFNKTSDKHYETPGFANATNKMYINISGGISDFKVQRY